MSGYLFIEDEVAKLIPKGIKVFILEEDLGVRGIDRGELVAGVEPIARTQLPRLLEAYEHVWHW